MVSKNFKKNMYASRIVACVHVSTLDRAHRMHVVHLHLVINSSLACGKYPNGMESNTLFGSCFVNTTLSTTGSNSFNVALYTPQAKQTPVLLHVHVIQAANRLSAISWSLHRTSFEEGNEYSIIYVSLCWTTNCKTEAMSKSESKSESESKLLMNT
jgi:hypothetical protein